MTALAAQNLVGANVSDLLEELSGKNHVRVVKYAARRDNKFAPTRYKKVLDEVSSQSVALGPMAFIHDHLRVLRGEKPIYVKEMLRRLGGELRGITLNLRTTVGIDYTANALGSTSQPSQADYIALSSNATAVAVGDTSATSPWSTGVSTDVTTGEFTGLGLTRKQATYAHTATVASYSMAATWTATGTVTNVQKAGLFGGAAKTAQGSGATNILYLENTFTATTLAVNDQLSLTWTVNC